MEVIESGIPAVVSRDPMLGRRNLYGMGVRATRDVIPWRLTCGLAEQLANPHLHRSFRGASNSEVNQP
jgi:hypothetical protein